MLLINAPVYIYNQAVDMRKSINGLSLLVTNDIKHNPTTSNAIYVFWNKSRDKLKILYCPLCQDICRLRRNY